MPTQRKSACAAHPVSLASSFDSSTQDLGETSVKHKRGRPHKIHTALIYDDYPENGTQEEKEVEEGKKCRGMALQKAYL